MSSTNQFIMCCNHKCTLIFSREKHAGQTYHWKDKRVLIYNRNCLSFILKSSIPVITNCNYRNWTQTNGMIWRRLDGDCRVFAFHTYNLPYYVFSHVESAVNYVGISVNLRQPSIASVQ